MKMTDQDNTPQDDSDADALAILSVLAICFTAIAFYLSH